MKIFMFPRKEASPKDRLGAKLKMIGAIHVVLGLACAVVGFCAIGIDQANIDFLKKENKTVEAYIILGLDSAPIVSSVWIVIAGLIPSCLICGSDYNLIRTKVLFMVFSIIAASLFVPIMILTSVAAYILRESHEELTAVTLVIAGLEFMIGMIASCFSCRSQWAACKLEGKRKKELRERYEDKMRKENNEGQIEKEKEAENNLTAYDPPSYKL